jgi:trimeric autotransporter adhesin
MAHLGLCVVTTATLVAAANAVGQPRSPHWEPAPGAPDSGVHALGAVADAAGPALYVGGRFSNVGGVDASGIARWDGVAWSPLGSGIPLEFNSHGFIGCCSNVHGFAEDNGTVHIAGNFIQAGGVTLESIAAWDGTTWNPLEGGVSTIGCTDCAPIVYSLARFGNPDTLYAAGTFDLAGSASAAKVARWDGLAWFPLGAGITTTPGDPLPPWVNSLTPYNGALYASGRFSRAGSVDTHCIARWDGASWNGVGGGLAIPASGRTPTIAASCVFDDGSGPALYVAGIIDIAGATPARNIAKWNGSSWTDVAKGVGSDPNDRVWAMAVFNDGSGPALYVAGLFADAGGKPASNIAKWNGSTWSTLDSGVDGEVFALAAFDDGTGPALYVGGWFNNAGGLSSPFLAKWAACPTACYANCDGSTQPPVLNIDDFVCFQTFFAIGDPYADCDASGMLNIDDFICFQTAFAIGC